MWQKARDSSTLHAVSWKLKWAEAMAFELDDTPDVTEEDIEEGDPQLRAGEPRSGLERRLQTVKGNATAKAAVRDRLIAEKRLVDRGEGPGICALASGRRRWTSMSHMSETKLVSCLQCAEYGEEHMIEVCAECGWPPLDGRCVCFYPEHRQPSESVGVVPASRREKPRA